MLNSAGVVFALSPISSGLRHGWRWLQCQLLAYNIFEQLEQVPFYYNLTAELLEDLFSWIHKGQTIWSKNKKLVDCMWIAVRDSKTIGSSNWAVWPNFCPQNFLTKFSNGVLLEESFTVFVSFRFLLASCLQLLNLPLDVWWRLRRTKKRKGNVQEWGDDLASSDAKCIEGPQCSRINCYFNFYA